MTTRTKLITVTLAILAGAAVAPPATAHFTVGNDGNRWWFGGGTFDSEDGGEQVDPVNMLFYPGFTTKNVVDEHFNDHWGPGDPDEWIEDQHLPDTPSPAQCKGDQWIRFRRGVEVSGWINVPTDFHGAGVGRDEGRCFNRFHIRFWGDFRHEQITGTMHSPAEAWVVGGAHYEENSPGHEPMLDWDLVERRILRVMHPHSGHFRWKCLPNSVGLYQGYRSDGRISRLGLRHGSRRTTPPGAPGRC
jgi:hypothetical protein